MANEADILNGKTEARSDRGPRGAVPIRKKAFHRALKRGEEWAVIREKRNKFWRYMSYEYNKMMSDNYIFMVNSFSRKESVDNILGLPKSFRLGDVINIRNSQQEPSKDAISNLSHND